ncbi:MAG: magnesium transporter [Planctomycetaceae bacterium]
MPNSLYSSLLQPDLRQMVVENDDVGLHEFCDALLPSVAAEVLEDVEPDAAWKVLSHCEPTRQAEIFQYLTLPAQVELVNQIDHKSLSRIIEQLPADDRVDLLERLEPGRVEEVLPLVAQAERNDIRKLLSYPEESAGSIMTTEYASLPANITVEDAFKRLMLQAPRAETIYYVYVVDENRRLIGCVSFSQLIQSRRSALLQDVMEQDVISVRVDEDQESVANKITKYDFIAIPVVDDQNKLVGIVTHDDAADVLRAEATEDAQMLAAVSPLEDSYLQTPFITLAWKRGIWLVILLGAASLTARILHFLESYYFNEVELRNWMVLFFPLVLASGGNAGSQSATLVIRAMALHETDGKVWQIVWREFRVGLLLGTLLGLLGFTVGYWLTGTGDKAASVGLSVFLVVSLGTVWGSVLPLGLKRFGMDPALMSNPLIASISDMLGVVTFYSIAYKLVELAAR